MNDKWRTIHQIREFNRFYTVLLGFLNRNYLDSGYSVTETRILFELKQNEKMNANRLIDMLHLDKGYISRLIRGFEQKGLITRTTNPKDQRALLICLTPQGAAEAEKLIDITNNEISQLIEPFSPETCGELRQSMQKIIEIFSNNDDSWEADHEKQQ